MARKRTLQELVFRDNFLFGAVMLDEEICREFLEIALDMEISHVSVSWEHSVVYNPEAKGVRLDVYARDEANTHFNVEMQAASRSDLPRRTRYYHSQIDMELLLSGRLYEELSDCFVIFVCDFDPFKRGLYRYTFRKHCEEYSGLTLDDGSTSIFLSTRGENAAEVSPELVHLMDFVHADLAESQQATGDEFVGKLQRTIRRIKEDREMGRRYMLFEEYIREEREEAYAEGKQEGKLEAKQEIILQILRRLGSVSDELEERVREEHDPERLNHWLDEAVTAKTLEEFLGRLEDSDVSDKDTK